MRLLSQHVAAVSGLALAAVASASFGSETAAPAPPQEAASTCAHPQGAVPGQCYAQVRTPLTWETVSERVLVRPAHTETRTIPARTQMVSRQEMVSPERVERHVIPAVTRQVCETVVVRPATTRVDTLPPVYETVTEQVVVRPARREWQTRYVGGGQINENGEVAGPTGVVTCLVEYPAEYATVQRQVLRRPAQTLETPIPAETRQVTRTVIVEPEREVVEKIPAVYRTIQALQVVEPARTESFDVEAVYETRTHQHVTGGGELKWKLINCPPGPAHDHPHHHASETDGERG